VFLYRPDSIYDDVPDQFYRFPAMYLSRARQFVGDWVVYMEPAKAGVRGYHAVAKVKDIVPDPEREGMFKALIEPHTYLELGRDVPFRRDGDLIERGILNEEGKISGRAQAAVRPLAIEDFNRILRFGLVSEEELLPRLGAMPVAGMVQEEAAV
jgi:putative restriction endonuclease